MEPLMMSAIAQTAETAGSLASQLLTRKWNLQDYARQRADALADWNRVNEYNSPLAQMTRYKEAGLNPNLIYGQMTTSPSVRSSNLSNSKIDNPFSGMGSKLIQAIIAKNQIANMNKDLEIKSEQIGNLKEEANIKRLQGLGLVQDNRLKAITANAMSEAEPEYKQGIRSGYLNQHLNYQINQFDYEVRKELRDTNIAGALQALANQKLQGESSKATIAKIKQETANLINSNEMQKLDTQFKQIGVGQNDNMLLRIGARMLYRIAPWLFEKN
jgi:hypothetical protein